MNKIESSLCNVLDDVRQEIYKIRRQFCINVEKEGQGMLDERDLIKRDSVELLLRFRNIRECTNRMIDKLGQ